MRLGTETRALEVIELKRHSRNSFCNPYRFLIINLAVFALDLAGLIKMSLVLRVSRILSFKTLNTKLPAILHNSNKHVLYNHIGNLNRTRISHHAR